MLIDQGIKIEYYMSNFSEYLDYLEKDFLDGQKQIHQAAEEYAKKMDVEVEKLKEIDFLDTLRHQFVNLFPNIILSGFLVSLYGFTEHELVSICKEEKRIRNLSHGYKDEEAKATTTKMKNYLKNKVQIPIHVSDWNTLNYVRWIRNAIAHNNGIIDQETLDEYTQFQAYLQREKIINAENEIKLSIEYCRKIIYFIHNMFEKICTCFNVPVRGFLS